MSSRRSRCRQTGASRITDDQIADLVYKLQQLIPRDQIHAIHSDHKSINTFKELEHTCNNQKVLRLSRFKMHESSHVSSAKVLQDTCNYIRSLHREVEDLSERLSELLQFTNTDGPQAAIIRNLLMPP